MKAAQRINQPPDNTHLPDRRVACDCDPRLHRPVMTLIREVNVHGCMRCGTVTCTKTIGDDGRFTGNSWLSYVPVAIPDQALAWIAQWPRATTSRRNPNPWLLAGTLARVDHHYLPADTRCDSVEELNALETRLAGEHDQLNNAQRLRQSGFPTDAPPANLPQWLNGYATIWSALQLRPDSPLDDLITHAQLDSPGSDVAADLLRQRPDNATFLVQCLRSDDRVQRSAGHALARLQPPGDPALASVVLEILEWLPLTPMPDEPERIASCHRFEALLILATELKLGTPAMLAALPKLQRKLARHDAELVKSIGIALRDLQGLPPLPRGPYLP